MDKKKLKFRHVVSKSKAKRWPKGHSCESNPAIRTHRAAAKTVLMLPTESQQPIMDSMENIEDGLGFENMTISGVTNFSTFSNCTNATFNGIENLWSSKLESHQDICAVLAAVTQVVQEKGGNESNADYFAALITAFESAKCVKTCTSIVFLLSIVAAKADKGVHQEKYSQLSKLILEAMEIHETSETNSSLIKSLILILGITLSKQPTHIWEDSHSQLLLNRILTYTISSRPKIRKSAHHAVHNLVQSALMPMYGNNNNNNKDDNNNDNDNVGGSNDQFAKRDPIESHPMWSVMCVYFSGIFQKQLTKESVKCVFHILNLLKFILQFFPEQYMKKICEHVLKFATCNNNHLQSVALRTLQNLFMCNPNKKCLSWSLNGQIIQALIDIQPEEHEIDALQIWLSTLQHGVCNLTLENANICNTYLPTVFSIIIGLLIHGQAKTIYNAVSNSLQIIVEKCLIGQKESLDSAKSDPNSFLAKILISLENGLKHKFNESYYYIFQVYPSIFQLFNRNSVQMVESSIIILKNMRSSDTFEYNAEVEQALAAGIKAIGLKNFLQISPLNLQNDLTESWIIPLLKKCMINEEIEFFCDYFIPMAAQLRTKTIEHAEKDEKEAGRVLETLEIQIWDLLPELIKSAVDIKQNFGDLAKFLGMALQERIDIRNIISVTLRNLIEYHIDNAEIIDTIAKYCKNYLPILFNVYLDTKDDKKLYSKVLILNCLNSFLKICPTTLIETYFANAGTMLASDEKTDEIKQYLLDIGSSMIDYVSDEQLGVALTQLEQYIISKEHTLQKKGYKTLERMILVKNSDFFNSHLEEIKNNIIKSNNYIVSKSRKYRLKCLIAFLDKTQCEDEEFITAIIPEVMLNSKEVNGSVRELSQGIIIHIGEIFYKQGSNDRLEKYLAMMTAGLASHEYMQSCAILCLAKLVHSLHCHLSSDLIENLLNAILQFSNTTVKQIIKYCFYFVNVFVSTMEVGIVMLHIKRIINQIFKWNNATNNQFILKIKIIIEKLLRKIGHERLFKVFPESQINLLRAVKKQSDKRKKLKETQRKAAQNESNFSDDDDDTLIDKVRGLIPSSYEEIIYSDQEETADEKKSTRTAKSSLKSRKTPNKVWIQEKDVDDDEQIIDLLDINKNEGQIFSSKPRKTKKPPVIDVEDDITINKDGKLVINDSFLKHTKNDESSSNSDEDNDSNSNMKIGSGYQQSMTSTKSHRSSIKSARSDKSGKKVRFADGSEYRSLRAGGDMKRKNKPDPYAYIPLNRKMLKRKSSKMQGNLKKIIEKVQKGAVAGKKLKRLNKK